MESWHKVVLTQAQVIAGVRRDIMLAFAQRHLALGGPPEMALFGTLVWQKPVTVFFTPACATSVQDLIEAYGGVSCDKPTDPVDLLVSTDSDPWSTFGLTKSEGLI